MSPDPFITETSEVGGLDVVGVEEAPVVVIPPVPPFTDTSPRIGDLIEIDQTVWVRNWTNEGGGIWSTPLPLDVLVVARVTSFEAGGYLPAGSYASMVATPARWFFDLATRVLYLHIVSADPLLAHAHVTVTECLSYGFNVIAERAGVLIPWPGRVFEVPTVSLDGRVDDLATDTSVSFGGLAIDNHDGRYDTVLAQRALTGNEIRRYRGLLTRARPTGPWTADLSTFTLWLRTTMDAPSLTVERCTIPLVARKLDMPIALTKWNGNAGHLAVWGTVRGATAFLVSSGLWRVSDQALSGITAVYTAAGPTDGPVTVLTEDLAKGRFTVDPSHDTEKRLYVDCVGEVAGLPGTLVRTIAAAGGVADVDERALTQLDRDRPVTVGLQVGSDLNDAGEFERVSDLLAEVQRSAFVSIYLDRAGVLTGQARKWDLGNLVGNSGFEDVTLAGWDARHATLSIEGDPTEITPAGLAYLRVDKAAPDTLAHAMYRLPITGIVQGQRYVLTCLVALLSGSTAAFRLALADAVSEVSTADITLTANVWQRVRLDVIAGSQEYYGAHRTDLMAHRTDLMMDQGAPEMRIYVEHGGSAAVSIGIDAVECVPVTLVEDRMAEYRGAEVAPLLLSQVQVEYGHRLITVTGEAASFAITQDSTGLDQRALAAEMRTVQTRLAAESDALAVGAAILEVFARQRIRPRISQFRWGATPLALGSILDVQSGRAPQIKDGSGLARVVQLDEQQPSAGSYPTVDLVGEMAYDPVQDAVLASP